MPPSIHGEQEGDYAFNWWNDAFTAEERISMEVAFNPLGEITAKDLALSLNPSSIGNLIGHFKKIHLREVGYKLIARADTLVSEEVPVLSRHFYFASRGNYYYRWRDLDSFALEEAIESFYRQIDLAGCALECFRKDEGLGFIPAHAGYRQLRIIEEKRGNFKLARELCKKAMTEGWSDDWGLQIARLNKKLGVA